MLKPIHSHDRRAISAASIEDPTFVALVIGHLLAIALLIGVDLWWDSPQRARKTDLSVQACCVSINQPTMHSRASFT